MTSPLLQRICISLLFLLIGSSLFAQTERVELYRSDGTILKGLAKRSNDKLKYRKAKGESAIRYDLTEFEKIIVFSEGEDEDQVYKKIHIKDEKKPEMLLVVAEGPVSIYQKEKTYYTSGYGAGLGVNGVSGHTFTGNNLSINTLYLKKENEPEAIYLGSDKLFSKNFKKAAADFFSDCPTLVKRIMNKEYTKKELDKIVEFYNDQCGQE